MLSVGFCRNMIVPYLYPGTYAERVYGQLWVLTTARTISFSFTGLLKFMLFFISMDISIDSKKTRIICHHLRIRLIVPSSISTSSSSERIRFRFFVCIDYFFYCFPAISLKWNYYIRQFVMYLQAGWILTTQTPDNQFSLLLAIRHLDLPYSAAYYF